MDRIAIAGIDLGDDPTDVFRENSLHFRSRDDTHEILVRNEGFPRKIHIPLAIEKHPHRPSQALSRFCAGAFRKEIPQELPTRFRLRLSANTDKQSDEKLPHLI